MSKKKKYPDNFYANFLIYDDKNMNYRKGFVTTISSSTETYSYRTIDYPQKQEIPIRNIITIETGVYEELNNIELDPTTMKRIAVYNKTMECKRLDKEIKEKEEKIKEKEEKIKELDDKLNDKEKRWKKVKEFVSNIYEIDLDDDYDDDE